MDQLEHHLLPVNGIDLSLYSAGPSAGRPVWLLHGFPECWHSWRQQIAPLVGRRLSGADPGNARLWAEQRAA